MHKHAKPSITTSKTSTTTKTGSGSLRRRLVMLKRSTVRTRQSLARPRRNWLEDWLAHAGSMSTSAHRRPVATRPTRKTFVR